MPVPDAAVSEVFRVLGLTGVVANAVLGGVAARTKRPDPVGFGVLGSAPGSELTAVNIADQVSGLLWTTSPEDHQASAGAPGVYEPGPIESLSETKEARRSYAGPLMCARSK